MSVGEQVCKHRGKAGTVNMNIFQTKVNIFCVAEIEKKRKGHFTFTFLIGYLLSILALKALVFACPKKNDKKTSRNGRRIKFKTKRDK